MHIYIIILFKISYVYWSKALNIGKRDFADKICGLLFDDGLMRFILLFRRFWAMNLLERMEMFL